MFRQLHRKLTLICAATTAVVLVGMSFTALGFSLSHLRMQFDEAYDRDLNAVFYYLQAQPVVDQAWLSRTEADGGLYIDIRFGGRPLRYTGQSSRREQLCGLAETTARQYGYAPEQRPRGVEPAVTKFRLSVEEGTYRASASCVPYGDSWINVILVKDMQREQRLTRRICITFAAITVCATGLLALFAYTFAGKAIRPIRESHERQRAFVSAASHELRTPLSVMRVGTGLLKARPQQAEDLAERLDRECATLSRLVDDLLLLARADDGRWSLLLGEESPKTIVLTACERFELVAHTKGVQLTPHIDENIPRRIRCDRERMIQVLSIVLDNAVEYARQGGVVHVRAGAGERTVSFQVEDDGPGIPQSERQRIFERFYRVDSSRAHTNHHGLGLSVAREIVELHRGSIAATQAESGGAVITVTVPIR